MGITGFKSRLPNKYKYNIFILFVALFIPRSNTAVCRFGLNLELPTLVSCGAKFEARLLPLEFLKSQVLNLDPETNYPRGFHYFPQSLGENSEVVFQTRPEPPILQPF